MLFNTCQKVPFTKGRMGSSKPPSDSSLGRIVHECDREIHLEVSLTF